MKSISASKARNSLYQLLDNVRLEHDPLLITGKRGNAVLLAEEDWNSIQETLYLTAIPGMRESILEGMNTPIEELSSELDW